MKKLFCFFMLIGFLINTNAYDKKSLVERFTNCSCGPCATINNSWYNTVTANFLSSGMITHVIYNVDWPSATDPMHILNQVDNNKRRGYYGVNSVPWIHVNGVNITTDQTTLVNAVNNGNAQYSPFLIEITPEIFSNNVINVHIKVTRDSNDVTVFNSAKLRVALLESQVERSCIPCCNNGELHFFNVTRKMLPDGKGTDITIPDPGQSVEYDFMYIPTNEFISSVNFDSLGVAAFIQNDISKEVYQSEFAHAESSNRINAAFQSDETLGAAPFTVQFSDYSTSNITSWEWDFNNDGSVDSQIPEPTWVYTDEGTYSVKLTVSDGLNSHSRILTNHITSVTAESEILVVNGIDYSNATYIPLMQDFYNNSACFGNHEVDVWDLFGDQGFNYLANTNILKTHLFNRDIPNSILKLYKKVIWIGNNFSGDLAFYNADQVLEYVQSGGNFLLTTRLANYFLSTELKNYCGITSVSGDLTLTSDLIALDENLVNMPIGSSHSLIHLVQLDTSLGAVPIFDEDLATNWKAGFYIQKEGEGVFVFISGRPYRFDLNASFANFNYIIDNFMISEPTAINEDNELEKLPVTYTLEQNYPNPFNPATVIKYQVPTAGKVMLKIYDLLGKEITTLVNENQNAGYYSIPFDASNLSSGIYFYTLTSGEFTSTKKMTLVK